MKTGLSIHEMATELQRQSKSKADYLINSDRLAFEPLDSGLRMTGIPELGEADLNKRAHSQVASISRIPKQYYDRCLEHAPDLLARQLNHWLGEEPSRRLVRTMDGSVRAVMSDKYRILDNWDFAEAILPAITENGGEVQSCDITEDKLYLKVVKPELTELIMREGAEMGVGHDSYDELVAALVASNSEVGAGKIALMPAALTTGCTNLAIKRDNQFAKTHLGGRLGSGSEGIEKFLADDTKRKQDEAIWMALRDVSKAALDGRIFKQACEELRAKRGLAIEHGGDLNGSVERLNNHFDLSVEEGQSVLTHLIEGNDLTAYGYHSAVTRASQDVESYDRATEMEMIGGDVITLSEDKFRVLTSVPSRN